MRRLLPVLFLLAGCAGLCVPPPARATTTALSSTTTLTGTELLLSSLQNSLTCTVNSENFFLLVSFRIQTGAENDGPAAKIRLHETASAVPDETVTVTLRNDALQTIQLPVTYNCATLGLGGHTFDVYATKTAGAGLMNLQTTTSFEIVSATVPAGVIQELNGESGALQSFALGTGGADLAWSSAAGVHTLSVPSASTGARGVITTGAQTLLGVKTFNNPLVSRGNGANSIAIGAANGAAAGIQSVGLGDSTDCDGFGAVCVGVGADAGSGANGGVTIGAAAVLATAASEAVLIGPVGNADATQQVGVGYNANLGAAATGAIGVGHNVAVTGADAVAVGRGAVGSGADAVCVGEGATCITQYGIGIGNAAAPGGGIALGAGSGSTANRFTAGSNTVAMTTVYFGEGATDATAVDVLHSGTGGSGANNDGGDYTIRGGTGTGTGFGGNVILQVCPRGGAGSSPNACASAWTQDSDTGAWYPATTDTYNLGLTSARPNNTFLHNLQTDGTTIETPQATQALTAVGNTITVSGTLVAFSSNANYTLTSAPTIANGTAGQIIELLNVDTGTDCITIQDQGGLASSNLRLESPTLVLCPRDSVRLRYNATIGDWVQAGQLVNVL